MEIEYVTHASLRIAAAAATLVLDPFYFLDVEGQWLFHYPPRRIEPDDLGRLDFVFCSHIHPDHSHPRTLRLLADRIGEVLVPAGRPGLLARCRAIGLTVAAPLENGVTRQLADGLAVTCFWSDRVDSVLVVEADGTVIFHQNDCLLDEATLAAIGRRFHFDVAFLGYTSAQSLYPLLLEPPLRDAMAMTRGREEQLVRKAARLAAAWRPRLVVPYAMTVTYFEPDQLQCNGYGRLVPAEFCSRLRARCPEQRTLVMQPGDRIDGDGRLTHQEDGPPWGDTLAEFLALVGEAAARHAAARPRYGAGDAAEVAPRVVDHLSRRLAEQPVDAPLAGQPFALRLVGDRGPPAAIFVDPDARRAAAGAPPPERPHIEITLPARLAGELVGGGCDPFNALYSRRVRFRRRGGPPAGDLDEVELYEIAFGALFDPVGLADYLLSDPGVTSQP